MCIKCQSNKLANEQATLSIWSLLKEDDSEAYKRACVCLMLSFNCYSRKTHASHPVFYMLIRTHASSVKSPMRKIVLHVLLYVTNFIKAKPKKDNTADVVKVLIVGNKSYDWFI